MFVGQRVSNVKYLPYPRSVVVNNLYYGYSMEGLSGIGSFFKKIGIGLGRIVSGGLWDPAKNRFFVPFSSGHMRTLGKGWTTALTAGFVNADKFFDSRTMRTVGTVAGIAAGAVAGGAAVSAMGGVSSIGSSVASLGSKIGSVLPSFGTAKSILEFGSLGMNILRPAVSGREQVEQPVVQEQVVQSGYPTLVNPMMSYPPYYDPYARPYAVNVNPGQGYYQYQDSNVKELVQSPSIQPSVEVVRERRELLPGGVEVFTISGLDVEDNMVDSFGSVVRYD